MATLEQISAALKAADAAGNTGDAKRLAAAYVAMRNQQPAAPQAQHPSPQMQAGLALAAPAVPTGRYMQDQRLAAQAAQFGGIPVIGPMLSALTNPDLRQAVRPVTDAAQSFQSGAMQGMTAGFGDEINAGLMTPVQMGVDAFQGKPVDVGGSFNRALVKNRGADQGAAQLNPTANVTGQVVGGFVGLGKGSGAATSTARAVLEGGAKGAGYGAAYGFGSSDGNLGDRTKGAVTGGLTGGVMGLAAPWLAKKGADLAESFLQNRATSAAIRGAPAAADLKAASSEMFRAVDQAGVTVNTNKFSQLVYDLASTAKRDRINPKLDPKAHAAYEDLIGALGDVQQNGGALSISDLHTLRQIAQKAALSTEGRDSMFANRIVDGLDHFVSMPGNVVLTANRLGNMPAAGNEMMKAISTWARSRRVGLLEEATYKAQNAASGFENGLRVEYRKLLQNKNTRLLFNNAELQAIQAVANGTPLSNVMRTLGHFGFDLGSGRNWLGGMMGLGAGGMIGGPIGAGAVGLGGLAARKVGQAMTRSAADRAERVVATPNIPVINLPRIPMIPNGGPLAIPLIDQFNRRSIQTSGGR